jgi:hypothetical protein
VAIMTAYWFRPKRYGYGAMPVTWQGWVVTGLAVMLAIGAAAPAAAFGRTMPGLWMALVAFQAAVLALLWLVARGKTEGGLRWRWGEPDDRA